MAYDFKYPTEAQIRYATSLLDELGYDAEEYELFSMSRQDMSALIDQLKNELEG